MPNVGARARCCRRQQNFTCVLYSMRRPQWSSRPWPLMHTVYVSATGMFRSHTMPRAPFATTMGAVVQATVNWLGTSNGGFAN